MKLSYSTPVIITTPPIIVVSDVVVVEIKPPILTFPPSQLPGHQVKERENPKKKTSSRASVKYISVYRYSGECEERNPKRATPLMADEKGARYMSKSISLTRYTETLKEKKREPLVGREIHLHRAPKPK